MVVVVVGGVKDYNTNKQQERYRNDMRCWGRVVGRIESLVLLTALASTICSTFSSEMITLGPDDHGRRCIRGRRCIYPMVHL